MGCSSSTPSGAGNPQPGAHQQQQPPPVAVAPPAGSKGKGKGKGPPGKGPPKGKGKGKGKPINKDTKFQVELSGKWEDYGPEEDGILKRAFLIGQNNAKFHLRGQNYEYSFKAKTQKNVGTGKERTIRPPFGMFAPKRALLPAGPMVVVQVPAGGGKSMEIKDPNNPSRKIQVALPPRAQPGARMAVPVPEKGQSMEEVVKKQQAWSTGAKVAVGAAAVGGLAVGGIVLGEHLSGGALSSWAEASPELDAAGDWAAGAVADAADWGAGAADTAGDWAGEAGDWAAGAADDAGDWAAGAADDAGDWAAGAADTAGDWAGDAGDWTAGAVDDAGDWAAGAAEDMGDWLGGATEDVGDFVTSLF